VRQSAKEKADNESPLLQRVNSQNVESSDAPEKAMILVKSGLSDRRFLIVF